MSNGTAKPLSKAKAKELNGFVEQLMQLGAKEYVNAADYLGHHRDMYGLLERIRRLEPKLRTSNGLPRTDNVEHFTKWATANGCAINRVRIAEQFGGLGLEATEWIPGGDCCIEVPRSLFFYVQNGPRFKKLLELMPPAMLREHGNIVLALALIMERFRKDSFWKPYFDVLPERYTTPLYFTPEDMMELRNTEAFLPALKLCKSIARQYGFIRKFVQDKVDELRNNFTYNVVLHLDRVWIHHGALLRLLLLLLLLPSPCGSCIGGGRACAATSERSMRRVDDLLPGTAGRSFGGALACLQLGTVDDRKAAFGHVEVFRVVELLAAPLAQPAGDEYGDEDRQRHADDGRAGHYRRPHANRNGRALDRHRGAPVVLEAVPGQLQVEQVMLLRPVLASRVVLLLLLPYTPVADILEGKSSLSFDPPDAKKWASLRWLPAVAEPRWRWTGSGGDARARARPSL
uniref:protein-histidine N-methyltransferase n=1 Tax=Anopheles atroparvus TaxID=41427 RepID=A0A182J1Z1_ANOAO